MSVISIQSHVAYGYVGNKAAVYPLQNMGIEVLPINTVQFSNHTGYGVWGGQVFSANHIQEIVDGLEKIGILPQCQAVLSGYMGSVEICKQVQTIVQKIKNINPDCVYLCDPVMGNNNCFVKKEVFDFFKDNIFADILTPNVFEAESICGIEIINIDSLKKIADYFLRHNVKIILVTGIKLHEQKFNVKTIPEGWYVFIATKNFMGLVGVNNYNFSYPVNGTGDLFSAVYLGGIIKTNDPILSLQNTIYKTNHVMRNTFEKQRKELDIISVNYGFEDVQLNYPDILLI